MDKEVYELNVDKIETIEDIKDILRLLGIGYVAETEEQKEKINNKLFEKVD